MTDDIIYTGEDRELEITLTDCENNPIDITSLTGLLVILYQLRDNVLVKYSRYPLTGYNSSDLVVTDAINGVLILKFQAEDSRKAIPGPLLMEIKARYNNVNYSGDSFDTITRDLLIAEVRKSITGSVNVLQ